LSEIASRPVDRAADEKRGGGQLREHRGGVFAALDLGTSNCRLMIAAPTRRGFRVIDSYSRIVRLGEGVQDTGQLGEAAMERTLEALQVCAARLRKHGPGRLRAVATEACRRASNGRAFLQRVRVETGLAVELIAAREEAELALESCAPLLQRPPHRHDRGLMFDIGGGSTELGWVGLRGGRGRSAQALIGWHSFPLGVLTLAERFGQRMFEPAGYACMVEQALAELAVFDRRHGIAAAVAEGRVRLVGTSGTVTTLAGLALGLPRYRRVLIDGVVLSGADAHQATLQLRGLGAAGLAGHPCVGPERARSVLPGCAIFEAIHRTWPIPSVMVADRGLRDGMLLRMMREAGLSSEPCPAPARPRRGGNHEPAMAGPHFAPAPVELPA